MIKSEFTKNILTLITGTTIAQAIPIAISPILTRLYSPEEFGVFALFLSVVSLASIIVSARYELAIMLPKKHSDALNVVALSLICVSFISFLFLVIIAIFGGEIARLLGNAEIKNWLYLAPLSVFLIGIYNSLNYWFNRHKNYKLISSNRVVQSLSSSSLNLGFGFVSLTNFGLIISNLCAQIIATSNFIRVFLAKFKSKLKDINRLKIIALAKKYKNFPLLNLPNAIIDTIRLSGVNFIINKLFGTAFLGQFSLAYRSIYAPSAIIGSAFSQVFFREIAVAKKSDLHNIIKSFTIKLAIIALPIFACLYFLAEPLFAFVFGAEWRVAGKIAAVMTPWVYLNFITSPLSQIFIVLGRQKDLLIFSIFYMIVPLSSLYFLRDLGFLNALGVMANLMAILLLILIFLVFFHTKRLSKK
ncbi:MAG: oligosaccharide flippase family protein [Campylobacter sp.]|nr:oligosaccharide flippase family protein [Campylobacter sp.]